MLRGAARAPVEVLLGQHVDERPARVAALDGTTEVTWADLAERVDLFRARLTAAGVAGGGVVAVEAGRGIDWYITVLALWCHGAGYLPRDPAWSQTRAAHAAEVAGARWSVVGPTGRAGDVVVRSGSAPTAPDGVSAAFITFTSGSTGAPKAVVNTVDGLEAALTSMQRILPVTAEDRVVAHLPTIFDASLFELCMGLATGAATVLVPDEMVPGAEFEDFLTSHRASVLATTPSILRALDPRRLPTLRTVICGGETLTRTLVDPWLPGRRLFNVYGPTEVCLWSSFVEVGRSGPITIGRPLPGLRFLVSGGGPEGSLVIAGAAVAAGYRGASAADDARFHRLDDGAPAYDTGDLVLAGDDGEFRLLGRVDRQVKVRGFRIEPGELEACVSAVEGVRETHAYVAGASSSARLMCAVVPSYDDADRAVLLAEQVRETTAMAEGVYEVADGRSGWRSALDEGSLHQAIGRQHRFAAAQLVGAGVRSVLEIGCGDGAFAVHLLPHVDHYRGLDVSAAALDRFAARELVVDAEVHLSTGDPREHVAAPPGGFDAVVLNSTAQYFPDAGYLLEVLVGAWSSLGPAGRLYLGDVRDLSRWSDYAAELLRARGSQPQAREIAAMLRDERELLLHPDLFARLGALWGEDVEVTVHRRADPDELARFRFDVCIARGGHGEHDRLPVQSILGAPRCAGYANHPLDVRRDSRLRAAIRQRCATELSAHLRPAGVVVVDEMPLTATGKTDERLLPALPPSPAPRGAYRPVDPVERSIAEVWESVLEVPPDGPEADFLAAGGSSLLLVQLVRALGRRGLLVTTSAAFSAPTVAGLAAAVSAADPGPGVVDLSRGRQRGEGEPLRVLIHPVSGNTECYRSLVDAAGWGGAIGLNAPAVPCRSESDLVRDYARVVDASGRGSLHLVGWSIGGVIAYKVAQQLVRRGREVRVSLIDSPSPLEQDPDRAARWDRLFVEGGPLAASSGSEIDLGAAVALIDLLGPPSGPACFDVELMLAGDRGPEEQADPLFARPYLGWPASGRLRTTSHRGGHFDILETARSSILAALERPFD